MTNLNPDQLLTKYLIKINFFLLSFLIGRLNFYVGHKQLCILKIFWQKYSY